VLALNLAPHRTSCEKYTVGLGPRKDEKQYLGSTLLDLEGGMGLWRNCSSLRVGNCRNPLSFRLCNAVGE